MANLFSQRPEFLKLLRKTPPTNSMNMNAFHMRMCKPYDLFSYQVDTIKEAKIMCTDHRLGMRGCILGATQGLGKTLMGTTLGLLLARGIVNKTILVLAPKLLIMIQFKKDIHRFYGHNIKVLLFHGDHCKMSSIGHSDLDQYDIVITTYGTMRSSARTHSITSGLITETRGNRQIVKNCLHPVSSMHDPKCKGNRILFDRNWGTILADESHNFADRKSKTYKSAMCLNASYYVCMSGTPVRNYSEDIYTQLKFVGYKSQWGKRTFASDYPDMGLGDWLYALDYEKAKIVLPPLHHHDIHVTLSIEESEIYEIVKGQTQEMLLRCVNKEASYGSVLALFIRLRQTCIAPFMITSECKTMFKEPDRVDAEETAIAMSVANHNTRNWLTNIESTAGINSSKCLKTKEIIEGIPDDEKILVFSQFATALKIVRDTLESTDKKVCFIDGGVKNNDRETIIEDFKKGVYNVLLIPYGTGSEGLNITEAKHVIFIEPWWCPATQDQALRRAWRIGQKDTVHVYNMLIQGSIEDHIINICKEKVESQGEISGKSGGLNTATMRRILGM
jgi:SNF2 family DNA or RNA helicase